MTRKERKWKESGESIWKNINTQICYRRSDHLIGIGGGKAIRSLIRWRFTLILGHLMDTFFKTIIACYNFPWSSFFFSYTLIFVLFLSKLFLMQIVVMLNESQVRFPVCLPIHINVCVYLCLYVYLSVYMSIFWFMYLLA